MVATTFQEAQGYLNEDTTNTNETGNSIILSRHVKTQN